MGEVFLDAFIDSLKVLAVLVVCNIIIELIEPKISKNVKLKGKIAPLIGVSVGLLPQCGFSVVATDLYQKRHITVGTLIGVYLSTSDEAIPIFLADPSKALHILPLIALKFVLGLFFGYLIDFVYTDLIMKKRGELTESDKEIKITECGCGGGCLMDKNEKHSVCDCENKAEEAAEENRNRISENITAENPAEISEKEKDESINLLCACEYNHKHSRTAANTFEEQTEKNPQTEKEIKKQKTLKALDKFLWHPILHSLRIFVYIFIVNIIFGIVIYFIGEDKFVAFLSENKYIAPFFAVLVGAIPNCVSSVILSDLYLMGGLGFGATLGGLAMNAGLGFMVLFKNTKQWKSNLAIFGIMLVISVLISYVFSAIFNFDVLHI